MSAQDLRYSPRAGSFVQITGGNSGYSAFFPNPLPPTPALEMTAQLDELLDRANLAVGELNGATLSLPDPKILLYSFVRKEAVLSSQIEGTQSSLDDLVLDEHASVTGAPRDDVRQTSNYLRAMETGLDAVRSGRLPLSGRLLREMHAELVKGTRGESKAPGQFRTTQNWIGGSRPGLAAYVPPPPHEVPQAIGNLELFLNDQPEPTRVLVKAALAHVQFETIHPFLDGNGRVGRLLITLILCEAGWLDEPMLYLSLHFKRHRTYYYELLQRIRTDGDFEAWLKFFLEGVIEISNEAVKTISQINEMLGADRLTVRSMGRISSTALQVYEIAASELAVSGKDAAQRLGLTEKSVNLALSRLEELGILREATGQKRRRVYAYDRYLEIVSRGVEEEPG